MAGFVGPITVPVAGSELAVISSTPVIVVDETTRKVGSNLSWADVNLTVITLDTGKITSALIEYSTTVNGTYSILATVNLDWDPGAHSLNNYYAGPIDADPFAPPSYYFRVRFFNGDGIEAVDTLENLIVTKTSTSTAFNGFDDAAEIFEVTNLKVNQNESAVLGQDKIATLTWDDLRGVGIAAYQAAESGAVKYYANGDPSYTSVIGDYGIRALTYLDLVSVNGYEVFMYVAVNTAMPSYEWPAPSGVLANEQDPADGEWYHVGSVPLGTHGTTVNFTFVCPAGKTVYFWVGARSANTQSSLNLGGIAYQG